MFTNTRLDTMMRMAWSKRRDFLQLRRYKKNLISVRLHYTTTREGNIKNTEEILAF